jgi:hypothetical protein
MNAWASINIDTKQIALEPWKFGGKGNELDGSNWMEYSSAAALTRDTALIGCLRDGSILWVPTSASAGRSEGSAGQQSHRSAHSRRRDDLLQLLLLLLVFTR